MLLVIIMIPASVVIFSVGISKLVEALKDDPYADKYK